MSGKHQEALAALDALVDVLEAMPCDWGTTTFARVMGPDLKRIRWLIGRAAPRELHAVVDGDDEGGGMVHLRVGVDTVRFPADGARCRLTWEPE